jgi:hypothetical protein
METQNQEVQPVQPVKKQGISTLVGIIIIVAVALILFGGVFAYQYFFVKPQPIVQTQNQTADYFEIKEFGLKFKITKDIKDLEYLVKDPSPEGYGRNILFSTKSLTMANIQCSVSEAPIGILTINNIAPNDENYYNRGRLLLADNGQYVYYITPQSTCSDNAVANDLQHAQFLSLQAALKTIVMADQTAGWKTYTNSQYGFEFKYPNNVVLNTPPEGDVGPYLPATEISSSVDAWDNKDLVFSFSYSPEISNISPDEISKIFALSKEDISLVPAKIVGIGGYKIIFENKTNSKPQSYFTNIISDFYFLEKNGKIFQLTALKNNNTANQMLSTFKFTK